MAIAPVRARPTDRLLNVVPGSGIVPVHVNAACSLDGRIALPGGKPVALSSDEDFRRVHRLRQASDAILVGVGTVIADDPSLLVKARFLESGEVPRHPVRVILDSQLRSPPTSRVFDGRAPTRVYSTVSGSVPGADVVPVPAGADGAHVNVARVVRDLAQHGHGRLMVEGGGHVIRSFLAAGLVDEMTLYVAPVFLGSKAPALVGGDAVPHAGLHVVRTERLGDGVLLQLERSQ